MAPRCPHFSHTSPHYSLAVCIGEDVLGLEVTVEYFGCEKEQRGGVEGFRV